MILAVGGQSYPGCGTTGDGYAIAKSFGHSIVPTRPALVPLRVNEGWVGDLSGVTLAGCRGSRGRAAQVGRPWPSAGRPCCLPTLG